MADKPLQMKGGNVADLAAALRTLASVQILVGFPEDGEERKEGTGMTNASLGYIHDQGAPEANIPARPFMEPGIESVKDRITSELEDMAQRVMAGASTGSLEGQYHKVGLIAKLAIQNKINDGVPPPLAPSTLRARARRGSKGAMAELEQRRQGGNPSTSNAKPLVDTGQMRNAVNYAIRKRGEK